MAWTWLGCSELAWTSPGLEELSGAVLGKKQGIRCREGRCLEFKQSLEFKDVRQVCSTTWSLQPGLCPLTSALEWVSWDRSTPAPHLSLPQEELAFPAKSRCKCGWFPEWEIPGPGQCSKSCVSKWDRELTGRLFST